MRRTAICDTGEHNEVPGTLDMSPKMKHWKSINENMFDNRAFDTSQSKFDFIIPFSYLGEK